MPLQSDKARQFAELHKSCFVIGNAWDAGSARILAGLGFQALATSSAAHAGTLGKRDGHVTRDEALEHAKAIIGATDLPVSADLENCFADEPKAAAETVWLAADVGLVGCSIEDATRDKVYEFSHALDRVAAAVEVARSLAFPFVLTARAENHIRGNPDLDDTVARLQAYESAGADVLYAPGLATVEEIRVVCEALAKPVNVLAVPGLTVAEVVEAGAQRVSVGGGLTWVAARALADAATSLRDDGDFGVLSARVPLADWFRA
jgi:2-methylisocitrate lyase-like PEP mutase family enzyme